jgi:putative ABC transport system permease protein
MTGNVLIEPKSDEDYIKNTNEIIKKALSIPGVVAVSPHFNRGITLVDKYGTKVAAQLKVVDPEKEALTTTVDDNIIAGKYLSQGTIGEILIGSDLTKKYRVQEALPAIDVDAGEKITVVFDNGLTKEMKVRGIYSLKFAATDIFVYATKEEAKQDFNLTEEQLNTASEILIKTNKMGFEDKVVYMLKSFNVNGRIWSWQEKLGVLNQFTDSLLIVSKITGLIGIIIAFATIYIMIYINVMQKRAQIGIMKAIGINKETILSSYIIQSFFYGLLGGLFGFFLTKFVIGYYTINPITMPMGDVVPIINSRTYIYSFIILMFSSLVAGYFASQGVIKENILDAIFRG